VTIADLNRREIAVMVPLLALMFFMGLYPRPLLNRMEPSVDTLLARVRIAQAHTKRQRILAASTFRTASSTPSSPPLGARDLRK
jgi:hypothetical protein